MWISKKKLISIVNDEVNKIVRERSVQINNLALSMTKSMTKHQTEHRLVTASVYGWLISGVALALQIFHDIDVEQELRMIVEQINQIE